MLSLIPAEVGRLAGKVEMGAKDVTCPGLGRSRHLSFISFDRNERVSNPNLNCFPTCSPFCPFNYFSMCPNSPENTLGLA